jgi:C4-type Zn-finger protein
MDLTEIFNEDITKYIGLMVIIVIIIYVIMKMANIQLGVVQNIVGNSDENIVEGMENISKDNYEEIKMNLKKKVDDSNDIINDEVKNKIEENLLLFDEYVNSSIIDKFNSMSKLDNDKDKYINEFNNLMKLKENLKKLPDIIDEL